MEKLYVSVTKDLVLFKKKQNNVFVFDGKVYTVDAKKKIDIGQALQEGAEWRSTKDGLLLLILNGRVILVTHRGHGGGYKGGWKKGGHKKGEVKKGKFSNELERAQHTTLKEFKEKSDRYALRVETQLVAGGIRTEKEIRAYERKLKKLIKDSDYCIRVKSPTFVKVLDSDFKNQIEIYEKTGELHSGGYKNPAFRQEMSRVLYGHDARDKDGNWMAGEEYEKYGFLAPKDMTKEVHASQYGDVIVRLKKENLKGRVTYTIGDSLTRDYKYMAGDMEHPTLAGCRSKGEADRAIRLSKSAKDINDIGEHFAIRYVEAQYHGRLTPQDIDSVTFTRASVYGSKESKEVYKKLKNLGVKVYYQNPVTNNIKEIQSEGDFDRYIG